MFWRYLLVSMVSILIGTTSLMAQSVNDALWRELLEQWAEQNDSETVPDDVVEMLQDCIENPINLNDTSSELLANLPFLTSFHIDAIRAYIAQNGEMVSLEELQLLNGFDSTTMMLMMPFVTVAPMNNDNLSVWEMLKRGRSNLRFGTKTTLPRSRGFLDDIYAGDPFRLYFRYLFKYSDRISLQVSGDKDAGENFRRGFDYYGYHLMLNDFGFVRRLVVGKYNLQFGQGVTLWSGSAPWMTASMPLRRYGQGIRPASAFCEYGYMRGAATSLSLLPFWCDKSLVMTLFYSNVDRDATLSSIVDTVDESDDVFQSISLSGYHRTSSELKKRRVLNEQLVGAHLQFANHGFQLGTTVVATAFGADIMTNDYVYNSFAFSGKQNLNCGFDATWRYRRALFFGEVGVAYNDSVIHFLSQFGLIPLAAVGGVQMHFDANTILSVAGRYVSPSYHNHHANVFGMNNSVQGNEGATLFFQTRLPRYIYFQSIVDIYRYPWMRYRTYSPSTGADFRIRASKDIAPRSTLEMQYRHRLMQRNSDGILYALEDCLRRQMQLSLDCKLSAEWRIISRLIVSNFSCDDHQSQEGFVLMQQVEWHSHAESFPLSIVTRLSLFDVDGYDARIYAYENDLMYEYSVPMITGRGIRAFLVARCDIRDDLSVALKYSVTYCPEKETMGSGYDLVKSNQRHEIKLQMRLKF